MVFACQAPASGRAVVHLTPGALERGEIHGRSIVEY
jgi:hypothetical protein